MRKAKNGITIGRRVRQLGLLLLLSPVAQAEPVWEVMKSLLSQGKAVEAYQQGVLAVEELEGELNFDYYYGMAAIDAGHVDQGVFALERVLYQQPNLQAAQLELARGYFLLEQYDLARRAFLQVLTSTPPQNVKEKIEVFLAVMEKRETSGQARFLAHVEMRTAYDSNTNFAPDSASFFSPTLGNGTLSDDGVARSGGYNDLLAGVSYYNPMDEKNTRFFRLDVVDHNVWWTNDLDTFAYTAQVGLVTQPSRDTNVSVQFLLQDYKLGDEAYRRMLGLATSMSYTLTAKRSVQFSASVLEFNYAELNNKDARELNLSAGLNEQTEFLYPALSSVSLQIGMDAPRTDTVSTRAQTERDFWRLNFNQRIVLRNDLALSASISYANYQYGSDDVIFQRTRDDSLLDAKVSLDWRWDLNWRMAFETGYKKQDSNIEIYNFDRTYGQVGVRYEFY